MGISKINHNFVLKLHYKFPLQWTHQRWLSRVPYLHMNNTLPTVKKVSDCPLTLSEPVPKKGLSVEALELMFCLQLIVYS